MYLPRLKQPRQAKSVVQSFGGYDHTESCPEGWFYEEENLSARSWPVLRPRLPRTQVQTLVDLSSLTDMKIEINKKTDSVKPSEDQGFLFISVFQIKCP